MVNSGASYKTGGEDPSYITPAKKKTGPLSHSPYKEGLLDLADFIMMKGF
jgi:hypothetical protein